ncbi:MAG: 1-deoxy-D-xylulose-5-phosphate reductoisomerase [Acidimicrobiia bacterium]|nr:1-deoxy-D-xylulose-5-phosphate reductoisomerase [Acidimicrobiia bacterium]
MNVVVLGATGSIGLQALEVCDRLGVAPVALAAGRGGWQFEELADRYPDAILAVADPSDPQHLLSRYRSRILFGAEQVTALAGVRDAVVVNGIVGFAGLDATLAALTVGNRLALANKESMVAAGAIVNEVLAAGGGELIPVDSEHSAIHQCLQGEPRGAVRRLVLTASGGPFRGRSRADLADVTPAEALAHPTWEMGQRISIDSATLVNKGLEVIEAHHLFGVPFDDIQVVVHPQSVVHSLVEFVDGSFKAHVGAPDMRIPIQYALTYPGRAPLDVDFDLVGSALTFVAPDREAFPALDLAYAAGRAGGVAPAVFNAADEVAVAAFLDGRLGFSNIPAAIARALDEVGRGPADSVEAIRAADSMARQLVGAWTRG